jgi:putative transposase
MYHPRRKRPSLHKRRSIRLKGFDYTQGGAYFVTLCTLGKICIFGEVVDGEMQLSEWGEIARAYWLEIPQHFPDIQLDEFVVMPNHIHGIVVKQSAQHTPQREERFGKPVPGSLPSIIRSFKSAVTKCINANRDQPGRSIWQRNYYERVMRSHKEMETLRRYISENPQRWDLDSENPAVRFP